jgi:hypothetical protein
MTRFAPQWLQADSYAASVDRRLIGALWPTPASTGCAVTVSSGMTLNVAAGQVAVPTPNNTGSVLCTSDAVEQVTLTAAPAAGNNRIDLVVCQARGNDLDGGTNNDFIFTNVSGTVAASPTPPAVPAGSVALAQVYVGGGVAAIVPANITDQRPGNLPAGFPAAAPRGFLGKIVGPAANVDAAGAFLTAIQININAVAGRWYRASANIMSQQITGAGNPQAQIANSQNTDTAVFTYTLGAAVSQNVRAGGTLATQATTTGTMTFMVQGTTSAGSFRFPPNSAQLAVEDIGTGGTFP